MHQIVLKDETDFEGWRTAARSLLGNGVDPSDISWTVAGSSHDLLATADQQPLLPDAPSYQFRVPARFVSLAEQITLHRNPSRFVLLYRLLWRLQTTPALLDISVDPDVIAALKMAKAVSRDQHKMEAFVRFREIGQGRESRFVAWFEPAHYIVKATSSFFMRRFTDMAWSILTPDICVHWDGHELIFTPGAQSSDAPSSDRLEQIWLTYYSNIFNPARLKIKAMQREMPKKYWRNLPEAPEIKRLIKEASQSTTQMIESGATDPRPSQHKKVASARKTDMSSTKPASPSDIAEIHTTSLRELRQLAEDCRACPLWENATQTVFGEGTSHAPLMFVGEQPGDKEDLAGKPFVGPAGQLLDRALHEAGIDRELAYVTNAVKHFKFVPRGKIRLHQKPNTSEIKACRPWYRHELEIIKPRLVVAMGASAAYGVFGRATPVNANRGRFFDLESGRKAIVTVHPSYLLRLPDEDARKNEYRRFVDDLKMAHDFLYHHQAA